MYLSVIEVLFNDYNIAIDENGITYAIYKFESRLKNNLVKCPCNYESFLQKEDIIDALKFRGVNIPEFWKLVLFAYDYADSCHNDIGYESIDTVKQEVDRLLKFFDGADKITVSGNGSISTQSKGIINSIHNHLLNMEYKDVIYIRYKDVKPTKKASIISHMLYYVLSNDGYKESKRRNREIKSGVYDIISQIVVFLGLVNDKYITDNNENIKSLIKHNKDSIQTTSNIYI